MLIRNHLMFALMPLIAAASAAQGAILLPSSYVATPGQGTAQSGSENYFDDTGQQLTDGVLGTDRFLDDLGNGRAYEWVAWRTVNPSITFYFDDLVHFDSVSIGFNRTDGASNRIPPSVNIGGVEFAPPLNSIPNGRRGWIDFPVDLTTSTLSVAMADNSVGLWIMVDEFKFNGVVVPEPSFAAISFAGLALGMGRRSALPHLQVMSRLVGRLELRNSVSPAASGSGKRSSRSK